MGGVARKKSPSTLDKPPSLRYNTHMENTTEMTFEEFTHKLQHIDWFYMMADDGRAYRDGQAQVQHYRDLAIAMGGEWQEAFNTKQTEMMERLRR